MLKDEIANLIHFMERMQGPKLLHISDTYTGLYPAVRGLLELIRPDLLIHTGDLADEYKMGRIPEHLPGYRLAVAELLELMQKYAARVWITHGNNDDVPWLEEKPGLVIMPMTGSRQVFAGLRLYLQHQPIGLLDDSAYDFALYGHSYKGDLHDPAANRPGQLCYFNGMRAASLIDAKSKQYLQLPYELFG